MDINNVINDYYSLESQIGEYFDTSIYEGIQDMRNEKWFHEEGSDVAWIEKGELYQAEVYGTSCWKGKEFTLFTLYSDFGGKFQAIFKNSNFDENLEE